MTAPAKPSEWTASRIGALALLLVLGLFYAGSLIYLKRESVSYVTRLPAATAPADHAPR